MEQWQEILEKEAGPGNTSPYFTAKGAPKIGRTNASARAPKASRGATASRGAKASRGARSSGARSRSKASTSSSRGSRRSTGGRKSSKASTSSKGTKTINYTPPGTKPSTQTKQNAKGATKPPKTVKDRVLNRYVLGGGAGTIALGSGLSWLAMPGDDDENTIDYSGAGASGGSVDPGEVGMYAAGGAALSGLGSLLYGKLKGKPNLQRDVIFALVGGAAGASIPMLKSAAMEMEKEGIAMTTALGVATLLAILGGTAASGIQSSLQHRDWMRNSLDQQREMQAVERAHLQEQEKDRKLKSYGAAGGLIGAAAGGTASNVYGSATGNESLKRDILSTLAGAGIGGAAGIYAANKA